MAARTSFFRSSVLFLGKKTFFNDKEQKQSFALAALLGLVLILLLIFFDIIPLSSIWAPSRSQPTGVLEASLGFKCPVKSELCKDARVGIYNGSPALIYSLPQGTVINALASVIDSKEFTTDPFEKNTYRGVWQSTRVDNSCYTMTYVISSDGLTKQLRKMPTQGESILITGEKTFPVDGGSANMVLQVQRRKLPNEGPDVLEGCTIGNRQPNAFGTYLKVDPSVLQ